MAIRKVGCRRVVVDGIRYLWRVRPRPTYCQGNGWGPLSIAVQHADSRGAVLIVELDRPRLDNWLGYPSFPVRPSEIVRLVSRALDAGWRPERPGPQFVLRVSVDG